LFNSNTNGKVPAEFAGTPAFRWSMMFAGLAITFLGMDIMVRRPMMRELSQVRTELASVERDMEELVGVRNQVWETNNLLTGLKSQYRQVEDARLSVTAMTQLRKEIDAEAKKTGEAFASLERLVGVQNAVLTNAENVDAAEDTLEGIIAMQKQAVVAGEGTSDAVAAIRGLIEVRDAATMDRSSIERAAASVAQLDKLKTQILISSEGTEFAQTEVDRMFATVRSFGDLRREIIESGEGIEDAQKSLFEIVSLKNELFNESSNVDFARDAARRLIAVKNELNATSSDIGAAQTAAGELIVLKDTIADKGGNTKTAFANTGKLFGLRDTLNSDMNLDGAEESLATLVQIQSDLNGQGRNVVDALETLEVLTNLSEELQVQVDSIGGMRKSLLDIILMESTVKKAVEVVKPLTELSNLRRMSDTDVREAAKTIMENRTARRTGERRTASGALKLDDVTLFGAEPTTDILVPQPRDLDVDSVIDSLE